MTDRTALDADLLARAADNVTEGVDITPYTRIWWDEVVREYGTLAAAHPPATVPEPECVGCLMVARPDCPVHGHPYVAPPATVPDEGLTCPDCGHTHLPMLEPWTASDGHLVVPVCDWPMGDGSGCECYRRRLGSMPSAPLSATKAQEP